MARPRKKRRTHVPKDGPFKTAAGSRPPKSMVIRMGAGSVGTSTSKLTKDFRRIMEPDTATRLEERKRNKLKDYTTMTGPLGVTHLFLFSRSENGNTQLRIALTPRGPTLTFRVLKYTLAKDVAESQKHSRAGSQDHLTPPLLVMNNFTSPAPADGNPQDVIQKQLESLTTTVFQSIFPAISPQATPVTSIQRVLLLNREPKLQSSASGTFILSLRHYSISTRAAGVSRRVRRFDPNAQRAHERKTGPLPNLGRLEDAAEYLLDPTSAGYTSASETELDTDAEIEVLETATQHVSNKKQKQKEGRPSNAAKTQVSGSLEKRSVKLTEIGPRMRLRLIKVEEGICEGKIMWHEFYTKTKEEETKLNTIWDRRRMEKEERRAIQRANVERKEKEKEARKTKGKQGEPEDESEMEWDSDEIEAEIEKDTYRDVRSKKGKDAESDEDVQMGEPKSEGEDSRSGLESDDDSDAGVQIHGRSVAPQKIAPKIQQSPATVNTKKRKLPDEGDDTSSSGSDSESNGDEFQLPIQKVSSKPIFPTAQRPQSTISAQSKTVPNKPGLLEESRDTSSSGGDSESDESAEYKTPPQSITKDTFGERPAFSGQLEQPKASGATAMVPKAAAANSKYRRPSVSDVEDDDDGK